MRNESSSEQQGRLEPTAAVSADELRALEGRAAPSDSYPSLGEPVALEFANTMFTTAGQPFDALTTRAALTRWMDTNAERIDAPVPKSPSAGDVARTRELRAVIRALLATAVDGASPPAAAVRRLNQLAALAPLTARLRWTPDEPPRAHLSLAGAGRVDALLALLAQSAIDVLGGSGAGRLRRCEAPGCINYYLKDHPRQAWCSSKCGNRVRVARHYQRTRRPRS